MESSLLRSGRLVRLKCMQQTRSKEDQMESRGAAPRGGAQEEKEEKAARKERPKMQEEKEDENGAAAAAAAGMGNSQAAQPLKPGYCTADRTLPAQLRGVSAHN